MRKGSLSRGGLDRRLPEDSRHVPCTPLRPSQRVHIDELWLVGNVQSAMQILVVRTSFYGQCHIQNRVDA